MGRHPRPIADGLLYHALNRGNNRDAVFFVPDDYRTVLRALAQTQQRYPFRLFGYCLMPNHFHLLIRPRADRDLGRWMQWLLTAQARRYHRHYGTTGHVWQGRFRAFPIQEDDHLLTVLRYAERNPVRAGLVARARDWPCSSAAPRTPGAPVPDPGPAPRPANWLEYVNEPQSQAEVERLRECLRRGRPFGDLGWMAATAGRLGLEASLRPRGRPRKRVKGPASLFGQGQGGP